jgi:hypothetical protein
MYTRVLLLSQTKSTTKSPIVGREGVRRTIAAQVLEHMEFVERGL